MRQLKNKLVIICNGPPASGKDTFCELFNKQIQEFGMQSEIVSSVGAVKIAATLMGWDGVKTPENRDALSDLKVLSESRWDGPNKFMLSEAKSSPNEVIFVHIREKRNIDRFIELCSENDLSVHTLYVHRKGEVVMSNSGDRDAYDMTYPYQHVINNNGTLEELNEQVSLYVQTIDDLPNAEPAPESLVESFKTFEELVEFAGSTNAVDKMLAEYMGAELIGTDIIEHPHYGRDVVTESWSNVNHLGKYAEIGIFDFSSNFNTLMKLAVKSNFDGIIHMNDARKTYENIALHVLSTNTD